MIRAARPDDVPAIASLIRGLAEYERLAHEVRLEEDVLGAQLFGDNPRAEVLVAEDDGETVGFALFFHSFSTFLGKPGIYLEDLFVKPEHRGRGHGRALLARLAELAVERGCGRLEWSVLDWNEPAIGFYRNLGAQAVDGWTVYRVTGETLTRLSGSVREGRHRPNHVEGTAGEIA